MAFITEARYVDGYRIHIAFDSGESGIVDLRDDVFEHKAAEPLRRPEEFARFKLDDWPTVTWACGFDLSPEYLYEKVTGRSPVWAVETRAMKAPVG